MCPSSSQLIQVTRSPARTRTSPGPKTNRRITTTVDPGMSAPTGNLHSSQGQEIMELFKKLNDAGTTIVQVTHSETNASYGSRVIRIVDGWIQTD